jgi:RimJ/RimL family protein N-acetyltransferase
MSAATEVVLRQWREADVDVLMALRNDRELQALLLARVRGSDAGQVRQWLRDRSSDPDSLLFVIAVAPADQCIGYVQLASIDWIDRSGNLGICLAPAAQGHGAGTRALELAVEALRSTWGIRKISLRVRSDNLRAIRCYERVGFAHCGLQRRHVRVDGAWLDVALMELFVDERP